MNFFQKLWGYGFIHPLSQLYRLLVQNLWDTLGNLWWYLKINLKGDWDTTSIQLNTQRAHLDLVAEMFDPVVMIQEAVANSSYGLDGLFKDVPVLDRWPTWTQTARIHLYRNRVGNCQDHMHFAKWNMQYLNSIHASFKQWKIRKNIYTPINPIYTLTKTHYFLSVLSPNGIEYQISNGRVTMESRDSLASRFLKGAHVYVWLTLESWSD